MANWNRKDIADQSGKVFIITGANSGVGFHTCLALAEKGATVVMACRSLERGQQALSDIKELFPNAGLELIRLDLASLNSVREFAAKFREKHDRLDVLINNGGPVGAARSETEDGFETHFGVNHLAHFALTGHLMEFLLKTPNSRVVTLSSRMHGNAIMDWDDLMGEKSYDIWVSYTQSKLANILFAMELSRRLEVKGASTISLAAHPGLANTNWVENNMVGAMKVIGKMMSLFTYQSAAMGSLPVLYAAVNPDVKNGGYYGPENDKKGYPVEVQAADNAYNESDAKRLWEVSEELTGVKFGGLSS